MTEQINGSDSRKEFERLSVVFTVLFLAILITPVPLVHFLSYVGMVIWIIILEAGIFVAYRVEKVERDVCPAVEGSFFLGFPIILSTPCIHWKDSEDETKKTYRYFPHSLHLLRH